MLATATDVFRVVYLWVYWSIDFWLCVLGLRVSKPEGGCPDDDTLFSCCGLRREHHYATTSDGYILNLQRLSKASTVSPAAVNPDSDMSDPPKPVLLIHGFLQDSDSFVCAREHSIAHSLVHAVHTTSGQPKYDVWLGNNRGNRYSDGHTSLRHKLSGPAGVDAKSPFECHRGRHRHDHLRCHSQGFASAVAEARYWDYCIDDLAAADVPCMIDHIRETVAEGQAGSSGRDIDAGSKVAGGQKWCKVVVIGFSQGSTQVFGYLASRHPGHCDREGETETETEIEMSASHSKVALFIALAPAVRVPHMGRSSSRLTSLVHFLIDLHPPAFFRTVLGSKCVLGFTRRVQELCPSWLYTSFVRLVMKVAFGWDCSCISLERQLQLFRYCYSFGSVKCVHHWYQISQNGALCGFNCGSKGSGKETFAHCSRYDFGRVANCPIALFVGDCDSVIDGTDLAHPTSLETGSGGKAGLAHSQSCCGPNATPVSGRAPLLPNARLVHSVRLSGYEHLDLIWADDVRARVNEPIMTLIDQYA